MLTWKKLWFRLFFLSVFLHINCLLWYPSCSCWLTSTLTSWLYCCYVVIPYHYTISYSTIVIQWYMHNMSDTQHSYQTTSYSLPPNLKRISNMIFCLSTRYNVWRILFQQARRGDIMNCAKFNMVLWLIMYVFIFYFEIKILELQ